MTGLQLGDLPKGPSVAGEEMVLQNQFSIMSKKISFNFVNVEFAQKNQFHQVLISFFQSNFDWHGEKLDQQSKIGVIKNLFDIENNEGNP